MPAAPTVPLKWENVYVFISSTFNDMHAERDYLVKRVFPDLREWCEQRKLRLIDIDLRWGVTEADAASRRALKVCLQRINDCRPFFLCFLGQRHGWAPGKDGISSDTFDEFPELERELSSYPAASITELEIRHAIFRPLGWRDPKNGRLHRYDPAQHAFFYLRDLDYLKSLANAPRQLFCFYTHDVGPEEETEEERAERVASRQALEELRNEIETRGTPHRPIHYSTTWRDDLQTPEITMPLHCPHLQEDNIKRWRNTWNRFANLGLSETEVSIPEPKRPYANTYNAALTKGRLANFLHNKTELAVLIKQNLQQAILERYPDRKQVEETTDLQRELNQQEEFIANIVEGFVQRAGDFDELDDYVNSDSRRLFVLTAPGGMGKSTLLAKWVDGCRKHYSVHSRFIGQSDGSSTVYSLMRFLLGGIQEAHRELDVQISEDPNELRRDWFELLSVIGEFGKTVILIDALNQLESGLSDLTWLPRPLPENVKMIVSLKVDDEESLRVHKKMQSDPNVQLSEVRPFTERKDREELVEKYLERYWKDLEPQLLDALIGSPGAINPLYLKVVLSELRVFGAFANLSEKIRQDFGDTPVSAFHAVLKRLETDPAYSAIEPKEAVPLLFGLLAHARHGLSVDELNTIVVQALKLANTDEIRQATADAIHLFLRQIRLFLARREGRYDYFYESFRIATLQRYVAKEETERVPKRPTKAWHGLIADYFASLPFWEQSPEPEKPGYPTKRKVAELPYHLTYAQEWSRLEDVLCDPDFIEAKCTAGLGYDLLRDYTRINAGNTQFGPLVVTAWRHQQQIGVECPRCLAWSRISGSDLGKKMLCPACRGQLQMNSFELDAEWQPTNHIRQPSEDHQAQIIEFPANLHEFADFVRRQAHILFRDSALTFQQSVNQKSGSVVRAAAQSLPESRTKNIVWMEWLNKPKHSDICLMTLAGHRSDVRACAFSRDNRRILSASSDCSLKIWDRETGREMLSVRVICKGTYRPVWSDVPQESSNPRPVYACAFSPDGRRIVSGCGGLEQDKLRIWNAETGSLIHILEGPKESITSCFYTPDGRQIVSSAADTREGELKVWDAESGKEIRTIASGYSMEIRAAAVSPDGRWIAAALQKDVRVWDLRSGESIAVLPHDHYVWACTFTPDGKRIATGSWNGIVRIWNVTDQKTLANLEGHEKVVRACAFSPDGAMLVTGSDDWTLKLWDVQDNTEITTFRGHGGPVHTCAFSPDGLQILSGSEDHTLKLWNAFIDESAVHPTKHESWIVSCSFSPDGKLIASASEDRTIKLWNAENGKEVASFNGHKYFRTRLDSGPGGLPFVRIWFDDSEEARRVLEIPADSGGKQAATARVHWVPIGRIPEKCAFSIDNSKLLSVAVYPDIWPKFWDLQNQVEITDNRPAFLVGHRGQVNTCKLSPDGLRFATASNDGAVKIWDSHTGLEIVSLIHDSPVEDCRFSPDGFWILCRLADKTLRIWNLQKKAQVSKLSGHEDSINDCAYSPDGNWIASASSDHTLRIWNPSNGKAVKTLLGHSSWVEITAYSPDGSKLLSGSSEGTLKLWDPISGKQLFTLEGHTACVKACAFSPDGRFIVSGSEDSTVRIWNVQNGVEVSRFYTEAPVYAVSTGKGGRLIAIGDKGGLIYILRIMGFEVQAPIVTCGYLFDFDKSEWSANLTARCEWCGVRFIQRYPAETPDYFVSCPQCLNLLRLNPFIIGRSRINKRWKFWKD
ncbi:DUF4062 domain-containing protein [bacterium]|nr:DUF4062 domain-containing protein [bacterium]